MSGRIAAMEAGLLSYLKTLPNIQAWAVALGQQLDDLDEVNQQLSTLRWLQNATGAQLDQIGTILGPARGTLSDSDYQTLLQARAAYLMGHGDFETLLQIVNVLANPTTLEGSEIFPAFVYFIVYGGAPLTSLQDAKSALQQFKSAGVGMALAQSTGTPVFAYDAVGAGQDGFDAGYFVSLV